MFRPFESSVNANITSIKWVYLEGKPICNTHACIGSSHRPNFIKLVSTKTCSAQANITKQKVVIRYKCIKFTLF